MKKVLSPREKFTKLFRGFDYKHDRGTVWRDFIAGSACSFAEVLLTLEPEIPVKSIIQSELARLRKAYSPDEINTFAEMLAQIVLELEANPAQDLIGSLWAELEIQSKSSAGAMGQFFTPFHVSEAMAQMGLCDIDSVLDQKPFITLNEPTCGAGGMIIAASKVLLDKGYNPQQQMHVVAQDLDLNCVFMCYNQLSLLGIPALVIHGDTLKNEHRSIWPTPFHQFFNWDYKLSKKCESEIPAAEPDYVLDREQFAMAF